MSGFQPAWWLRNPHLQTLWSSVLRKKPRVPLRRERFELPDGDFLDLDWTPGTTGPLVVIFHGLEGSAESNYAKGLLAGIHRRGWRSVLMHFRGCSGELNRRPRSYHSGETGDMSSLFERLQANGNRRFAAVGFSLGGNALLKYMGESGAGAMPLAAVAVSVPFDLNNAAEKLECGFSRLYQWYLLRRLRAKAVLKYRARQCPMPPREIRHLRTFKQFDDRVTAPLHGFTGASDYYQRCSSRQFLMGIAKPTLILHAADDPFMTPQAIPQAAELSTKVKLELSSHGGHVGFVSGYIPLVASYWLEQRILDYLEGHLP